MTYPLIAVPSSGENSVYKKSGYPDLYRLFGVSGSFKGHRVTASEDPALTTDNVAPATFIDGYNRLPEPQSWAWAFVGLISTTSKNLWSQSSIRTSSTPADPDVPRRGIVYRCVSGPYHFVGRQVYYIRVHLWHGILSTGRGMNYGAIKRVTAEVVRLRLNLLAADEEPASTVAGTRRTVDNWTLFELYVVGPLNDMNTALNVLCENLESLKPKKPAAKVDPEQVNFLAIVKKHLLRQFAEDSGNIPEGSAASALAKIDKLLEAGVVLSADRIDVDALVAQLIQDMATINKIAQYIDNPELERPAVNDLIVELLKERGQSCLQILRRYGFFSLSEADRVLRAIDYLMTGFKNPNHKLNYVMRDATGKALDHGGKDDVVDMIMSMTADQTITFQAGWSRSLTGEVYLIGELPGPGSSYLGGIPYLKASQAYDYELKFSKHKDGGVTVTFGRTGTRGISTGSGFWVGGKLLARIFNLELTVTAKISRDYTNNNTISFTLDPDNANTKNTLSDILHGKIEDPYAFLKEQLNPSSVSEQKVQTALNLAAGFAAIYGAAKVVDGGLVEHDNQSFFYPQLSVSKDFGYQRSKTHSYVSGKHTQSEAGEFFSNDATLKASIHGQARSRFTWDDIGTPGDIETGRAGLITNTNNNLNVTREGDRTPLFKSYGKEVVYGDNDAKPTATTPGRLQPTGSAPNASYSWSEFMTFLRKLLKDMLIGDLQGDYGKFDITRDSEGYSTSATVDVTLPRNGEVLKHPQIKAILDHQEPGQQKVMRDHIVQETSFTTKKNRLEIKQQLNELDRHLPPEAKRGGKIDKLRALADFTSADGWVTTGDRQAFRKEVYQISSESKDQAVKEIADKLLANTDNGNTELWPLRGNGTKITLRLDVRPEMIKHIKLGATTSHEIKALVSKPDFFNDVSKTTVKQSRFKASTFELIFPIISCKSSAKMIFNHPSVQLIPKLPQGETTAV